MGRQVLAACFPPADSDVAGPLNRPCNAAAFKRRETRGNTDVVPARTPGILESARQKGRRLQRARKRASALALRYGAPCSS